MQNPLQRLQPSREDPLMRGFSVLLLCLVATACKPQATPQVDISPAPAVASTPRTEPAPPAARDSACPAVDFDAFAEKFAGSISLQARYTHWPLESTTIDAAATPEPKPVTKQVTEKEMSYPLLMAFDRARREGQAVKVLLTPPDGAEIHYTKPDSDYSIHYLFKRQGACWQLAAIRDESL